MATTTLPKPTAAQLKGIADRALAATGKVPTKQAVLNTYARWGGGGPTTAPKPPATAASAPAAASKQRLLPMAPSSKSVAYPGPGVGGDPATANAYWSDFLARLKAGESPRDIEQGNVQQYGGRMFPGQGPEQNLSAGAYEGQVLQQYEGSPTLDNIAINQTYDPKAWLAYLKKIGVKGWEGMASGQQNPEEFARMLEYAGVKAGVKGGRYGFGYDDKGRRLSIPELIAALG